MIDCDVGVMDSEGSDSEGGEVWEDEEAEKKRIDGYTLTKTCECHFEPTCKSTACSTLFGRELIATTRMNCREVIKAQLDLVILANLETHQHHQQLLNE